MLKNLEKSQVEKLRSRFREHPLLLTCQQAFRHYMASMESFNFTSEDLFVETAVAIDEIFDSSTDAQQYLKDLWDNLKIKLKSRTQPVPSQGDLNTVCSVLFYVVAATLSLHWRDYYKNEIVDLLRQIVEKKGLLIDIDEQKDIVENLCAHSEGLEAWINEYEDSEGWLSDEIEEALFNGQDEQASPINIIIFDYKLNQDAIAETIKVINRNGLGEINFSYAIHSFFESIKWLSDTRDTKYVLWMKSHNLMTVGAKDLKQATSNDNRVISMISNLHTIFQERHAQTGKWKDKRDFYKKELRLSDKQFINSGE